MLVVAISLMFLSTTVEAQTYKSKPLFIKSTDGRAYFYDNGWQGLGKQSITALTTTDSAYNYIDSVIVASNESGILEVQVLGFNDSLALKVLGKQIVSYSKVGGTLTLGTPTSILTKTTDSGLQYTNIGSTWDIVAVSNNIYIRVKGKLTYSIRWESIKVRQYKKV